MKKLLYFLTFLTTLSVVKAQTIENFTPKNGKEGTEITITGSGFTGTVEVAFGESAFVAATVNSSIEITANVPSDATFGKVKVKVNRGSASASEDDFRYVSITCFSPNPAKLSEEMIIQGTGFATRFSGLGPSFRFRVNFGGSSCRTNAFEIIEGRVAKIIVPSCAQSGSITVEVDSNEDEFNDSDYESYTFELTEFEIAAREDVIINSFSPASVPVGGRVRITGTGFSLGRGDNKVTFGDKVAQIGGISTKDGVQTLTAYVPSSSATGKIRVSFRSKMAETPTDIEILNPIVEKFRPEQFRPEHVLTITGKNFARNVPDPKGSGRPPLNDNKICFEDVCKGAAVNANGTELTIEIPNNIPPSGTLKVKVGTYEVVVPNGTYSFLPAVPLSLTDFEPKSARMGETVTLIGTGFEQNPRSNRIAIQGAQNPREYAIAYEVNEDQTRMKVRVLPNVRGRETEIDYIEVSKCLAGCGGTAPTYQYEKVEGFTVPVTPEFRITDFNPKTALIGQEITITGSGFSLYAEDNQVRFGSSGSTLILPRAYSVNEDGTEIKARVHSTARSGTITVFFLNLGYKEWSTTSSGSITIRSQAPVIESFSPNSGGPGTEVTINGENFPVLAKYNEVCFAYTGAARDDARFVTASWVNETGTQLRATIGEDPRPNFPPEIEVPDPFPDLFVAVRSVKGLIGESTESFSIIEGPPTGSIVSDFTPKSGAPGTEVTISGSSFSVVAAENTVSFSGTAATPSSSSATSITVRVPYGAQTGLVAVSAVGEGKGESTINFTIPNPIVSGFNPQSAAHSAQLTINGSNFSETPEENTVTFGGGERVTPSESTTSSLTLTVPSCAVTGRVSVNVSGLIGTSESDFTVIGTVKIPPPKPIVRSFQPKSVSKAGIPVTISGAYFSSVPEENILRFAGGIRARVESASFSALKTTVPTGARTGRVTVRVNGVTGTSTTDFVISGTTPAPPPSEDGKHPPIISNFKPKKGGPSTEILISGMNFSSVPSANTVFFGGGIKARVFRSSETSVQVIVPQGARTGRITVTVDGQRAVSNKDFTVPGTEAAPEPSPTPRAIFSVPTTEESLGVYPNPTSQEVRFRGLSPTRRYIYSIYSLVGQQVLRGTLQNNSLQLTALSDGQYVLLLQTEDGNELLRTRLLIVR